MPFSYSNQISTIVGFAESIKPASVLDVGVGMGQYGFLLRMNLENINLFKIDGAHATQRPKDQWKVRIDGIEGYAGYFTPVHDYVYNNILVGDALEMLAGVPDNTYELVLAIDILEHFEKPEGFNFLRECRRVSRGAVLISTPRDFHHQEVEANPLENHRSHWNESDLQGAGFAEFLPDPLSVIAVSRRS
jgi:2-polyprenyl-3-methyl-5-hydroxy-6-metoxy-1,4-benzoquinol methylase